MSTSLKSKLSNVWARLTGQEDAIICSHTFQIPLLYHFENVPKPRATNQSVWLEATKIKGQPDQYRIVEHSRDKYRYDQAPYSTEVYSRQAALNEMARWETGVLQGKNEGGKLTLGKKSHSRGHIGTELIIDGVDQSHSVVKAEEKDKAIRTEAAAGIAELEAMLEKSAPPSPRNNRTPNSSL
jgi:hypothetical protein